MMSRRRKYALFTADGRLGNQLFQAAFLDSVLSPGDVLYTTGMGEFLDGFEWGRYRLRNNGDSQGAKQAKRWARRLGKLAVSLRMVDGIQQLKSDFIAGGIKYSLHGQTIVRSHGLFSRLLYVGKGYYQQAAFAEHASFRLKPVHLAAGRAFLDALPPGPRAFVHVRRGDYRSWEILGRSPLLGLRYFLDGMALIKKAAQDTQFILLSDEPEGLAPVFEGYNLHVFQGANVYEDFGVMTMCDGGVISNSTLSWWGGNLCKRKLPIVSPEGFVAVGLGFDYPPGITADWMTQIPA